MKKITLILLLFCFVFSCKKEAKTEQTTESNMKDSVKVLDSAQISAAENPTAFRILPISEKAEIGKIIFTENGKTIISYDSQANTGKININGQEYALDHLVFSENNYEISGENILIYAKDGNFSESATDCNYGVFDEISVTFNQHESRLSNVKVTDCPNYN